jgi:hypothetical protein
MAIWITWVNREDYMGKQRGYLTDFAWAMIAVVVLTIIIILGVRGMA